MSYAVAERLALFSVFTVSLHSDNWIAISTIFFPSAQKVPYVFPMTSVSMYIQCEGQQK